jgi:anti-anti-sigma regulatory factor
VTTTRPARPRTGPEMAEEVDPQTGRVRVRGHLTRQGADLLRGTAEALRRQGRTCIVLDLSAVDAVDEGALEVLRALSGPDAASGSSVVLVQAPRPAPSRPAPAAR